MNTVRVHVLHERRFASRPVDAKHGERILAAFEHVHVTVTHDAVGTVTDINELAGRMNVNRARKLALEAVVRVILQRAAREENLRHHLAIGRQFVNAQLVAAFHRNVNPRLRRMQIEMPRSEAGLITELSGEFESGAGHAKLLERAGIFRAGARRIVAARAHEQSRAVAREACLMGVHAGVDDVVAGGRFNHCTAVTDPVKDDRARPGFGPGKIVRHRNVRARAIDGHMNRTERQNQRIADLFERTVRADTERRQMMKGSEFAAHAVAARHIQDRKSTRLNSSH